MDFFHRLGPSGLNSKSCLTVFDRMKGDTAEC
jgi:hypothetical protein